MREMIQKSEGGNVVVIFSKSYCPYAKSTKEIVKSLPLNEVEVIELDKAGEPRNGPVQKELEKKTGTLTVPQVFANGKFFGSDDDIKKMGGEKAREAYLAKLVEMGAIIKQ